MVKLASQPAGSTLKLDNNLVGILQAYASILFANNPFVGLLFLSATFVYPNAGLSGLIAAITGLAVARMLGFPNIRSGLHIYNSLLVGLSIGIAYKLDAYLVLLIIMGAALAVFVTVAVSDMFWRMEGIPALSFPFVLVALTTAVAAQGYGALSHYMIPFTPIDTVFSDQVDGFFRALGSTFFSPNVYAGMALFTGLLITSRYITLLAACGYAIGTLIYTLLSASHHGGLTDLNGFNFILTAVALGGIFCVPSWASFFLAMSSAAMAALVTAAVQTFMLVYGLPVMALPFLITTLTILIALSKRVSSAPPVLLLTNPDLPEKSFERSRLYTARGGKPGSTPVLAPFFGRWSIYQGFNGPYTHQGDWRHALDFFVTQDGKSFKNDGKNLDDFFCFDLPVVSPVFGSVVDVVSNIADNSPGDVDTTNNWGNYVLIYMDNGLYTLIAHLKQHSAKVEVGARVRPGQLLGKCGNSGRSPQPHIHMHVQTQAVTGSPTAPFHLTNVLHTVAGNGEEFSLACVPATGDSVHAINTDNEFAHALKLSVGKTLEYQVQINDEAPKLRQFEVQLDLYGQFRIETDRNATVNFDNNHGVFSMYERNDVKDDALDAFILAMGLTPLLDQKLEWMDSPALTLLPLNLLQNIVRHIRWPLGKGLTSTYHRSKNDIGWLQQGSHYISGLGKISATSTALVHAQKGVEQFSLSTTNKKLEARLERIGQTKDQGVPGWVEEANG